MMSDLSYEVEFSADDIDVLKRARDAWNADVGDQESGRGWRRAELLCPDFFLVFNWQHLLDAGVLEHRPETFSDLRITLLGLETLTAIEDAHARPTKTREEIDRLKANWRQDPCWDIEGTKGFEPYHDELLAFRLEVEAKAHQRWLRENAFADEIGKPDAGLTYDAVRALVYNRVEDEFQGYVYTSYSSEDNTAVYTIYILTSASNDAREAEIDVRKLEMMQRLAARLHELHPDLTITDARIVHREQRHAAEFMIQRTLTEADMIRGQHFRLEWYRGSSLREQAAFERQVSAQVDQGFTVAGIRARDGEFVAALVRS
jgi:hypothetical protein